MIHLIGGPYYRKTISESQEARWGSDKVNLHETKILKMGFR